MITKIISGTVFAALLLASVTACGDNSSNSTGTCNGFMWTQEVSDEATAFSEAAAAFGQDRTLQKCEAFKEAYGNYVDALEDVNVSCFTTEINEQEYREVLAEAKAELNELNCAEEVEN